LKRFEALVIVLALSAIVTASEPSPVTTVEEVDLDRYCGTWYEIARLPNKFQRDCASNTIAEYVRRPDGKITVVNSCRTADGDLKEADGIAKKADKNGSNAKLKVRFAPSWIGWLPFVWGNYWIIDLAPDYSYAAVGDPSRKYLWILSRSPHMEADDYDGIVERVKAMGFDVDALIMTKQD
jgi:apolipoprotein D and lipocalin family protein